jgi:DNA-binding cell septation regulator SpoVG
MKIIRMNSLASDAAGKTAAFFDFQTSDGIIIKGFRIVKGANGNFVSAPQEKGKDGKYYDKVTIPEHLRKDLEKIALEEYSKMTEVSVTA